MGTTVATPGDFWRLAEEAERRGVRILVEPISGEHFATSSGDPDKLYRVTAYSCTCRGFMAWQRCTHYAALLARLGWLPDPEPEPSPAAPALASPAAAPCPECGGTGQEHIPVAEGRRLVVACFLCEGSGEVEGGEPDDTHADTSRHDSPYDAGRRQIEVRAA
jgi:hypothetical protein